MRIQSRKIDDLRPDVAATLKIGVRQCAEAGVPIKPYATYRNQEYQTWLNQQGKAPPTVTFHGARLAFDLYIDIPGHNYDSKYYVNTVAPILKKLGFSWMWDIARNEMAHFQWDEHRKYKNADILAGRLPPPMPLYQEEDLMAQFIENMAKKYKKPIAEVEAALESLLNTQLHTPQKWEVDGVEVLKTKGFITQDHDPNSLVTMAILGTIESRRK